MYWIVNWATKEFYVMDLASNPDFFDGDWRKRTPFPDANYIDLHAQRVRPAQQVDDYLVWGDDLSREGMIVGIYYDKEHKKHKDVTAFIDELRRKQDVAYVYIHPLTRIEMPIPEKKIGMKL